MAEQLAVSGAQLEQLPVTAPPIYFGGFSPAALDVARHVDVYLSWGRAAFALAALGISEFVLSGYPHLEEAYWFGEGVLPVLRQRGLLAEADAPSGGRDGAAAANGVQRVSHVPFAVRGASPAQGADLELVGGTDDRR